MSCERPLKKPRIDVENNYSGYQIQQNEDILKIEYASLSPENMFKDFISERKPVIITKVFNYKDDSDANKWSNVSLDLLNLVGSDVEVTVERRERPDQNFGRGRDFDITTRFGDFVQQLKNGAEDLYFSAQELSIADNGIVHIAVPPISTLIQQDYIPLRPKLMGNLIPQTVNMWIGNSQSGSSSGLHHDFHDNLYILIGGRKRFRIFSPNDADKMYTYGDMVRVHENGRINYKPNLTYPDGRESTDDILSKLEAQKVSLEDKISEVQKAVESGIEGAAENLADLEDQLENLLEKILDQEIGENGEDENEKVDESDSENDDKEEDVIVGDDDDFNSEEDNEDSLNENDDDDDDEEEDDDDDEEEKDNKIKQNEGKILSIVKNEKRKNNSHLKKNPEYPTGTPENFCQVDFSMSSETIGQKFPRFAQAIGTTIEIESGDAFYLPAGWFHEVTSFSSSKHSKESNLHMALNYWFHPLDTKDFVKPYSSPFWVELFTTQEQNKMLFP